MLPRAYTHFVVRLHVAALQVSSQYQGCKALNRIQSIVFKAAYTSNENLLVCAPTGAGKTNVAMLAILHTIEQVACVLVSDGDVCC